MPDQELEFECPALLQRASSLQEEARNLIVKQPLQSQHPASSCCIIGPPPSPTKRGLGRRSTRISRPCIACSKSGLNSWTPPSNLCWVASGNCLMYTSGKFSIMCKTSEHRTRPCYAPFSVILGFRPRQQSCSSFPALLSRCGV